jgi:hypothetical protein
VLTDSGAVYRRNRKMLRATPQVPSRQNDSDNVTCEQPQQDQTMPTPERSNEKSATPRTPAKSNPRVSRSGRTIKTPMKLKDTVSKVTKIKND